MAYETFIAERLIKGSVNKKRLKQPVIRLAVISVALGVSVMILAVMIVTGFRNEITEKVSCFAAHIRVNSFESNNSLEEAPISLEQPFLPAIKSIPGVKYVQPYAQKAGILKTATDFEGVVLKGTSKDYNFSFLKEHLIDGKIPNIKSVAPTYEVLISENTANKLHLKKRDSFLVYFLENEKKVRKFTISGIYKTGLSEEFDNIFIFCDIRVIQKLNNWSEKMVAGFEIYTYNFQNLEKVNAAVYNETGYLFNTKSIKEIYPQIFNWLELQNINVAIIIALMILVAGINMISTLLIIILENTLSIGILKAMGAGNKSVRYIFLQVAYFIILRGLFFGNLVGLTLCWLQSRFQLISLPQESYYVSSVPVNFSWIGLIMINLLVIIICFSMLIIPSNIIGKISPVKVLQFD